MFNKYYLDVYIDEVLQELHVEPSLQPRVEGAVGSYELTLCSSVYLNVAQILSQQLHLYVPCN